MILEAELDKMIEANMAEAEGLRRRLLTLAGQPLMLNNAQALRGTASLLHTTLLEVENLRDVKLLIKKAA